LAPPESGAQPARVSTRVAAPPVADLS